MKTIYLCGPINGRTTAEATEWRELAKQMWSGRCLDPMRRDYRGRELEPGIPEEIVRLDKEDIKASDGLLVFFDQPSVGTSMEMFYAWQLVKPVVVVVATDRPLSPWLVHHSNAQVRTMAEAIAQLKRLTQF